MKLFAVLLLLLATSISSIYAESTSPQLLENWGTGFKMKLRLQVFSKVEGGWKINLKFSKPIQTLHIWRALIVSGSGDEFELENMSWNPNLGECTFLEMEFMADKKISGEAAATAVVTFTRKSPGIDNSGGGNACGATTSPSSTDAPNTVGPNPTTEEGIPTGEESVEAKLQSEWNEAFNMLFKLEVPSAVNGGWKIKIHFSVPVERLEIWQANFIKKSDDGRVFEVDNKDYNANLPQCAFLEMPFIAHKVQRVYTNPTATVYFQRKNPGSGNSDNANACISTTAPPTDAPTTANPNPTTEQVTTEVSTSQPATDAPTTANPNPTTEQVTTAVSTSQPPTDAPTTSNPNPSTEGATTAQPITTENPTTISSPYNYDEVLHKSILFYEAQRSGKLPASNRVPWRKDSALGDKGDNGEDLTGGWYDAGDHVKFGFPMASSVTVLAWGLIQYRDAYQAAGELNAMLDCIKWPLDYFIKAHTAKFEFYGQVGDGNADHAFWGRPEDMTMARPAFKITTSKPGSELAAETAAALAAASIAFKQTDPSYASTLLQHAKELYEFADTYRGKYTDSIPNAAQFYNSFSGFNDELVWGAAWLYKATNEAVYLTKAEQYYQQFSMSGPAWAFSWDDKKAGVQLLLAEITGTDSYKQNIISSLAGWLPSGGITYTPKGLAWRIQWGANRYSANTAFLALVAADLGLNPTTYRDFAKQQIHYMLGDTGRSYVVGFGNNPPQRPHHRSSSCELSPATCDSNDLNKSGPNPQVLYGALVGGPDANDNYADVRTDYVKNEVATDYNAGFQSAVAGLRDLL